MSSAGDADISRSDATGMREASDSNAVDFASGMFTGTKLPAPIAGGVPTNSPETGEDMTLGVGELAAGEYVGGEISKLCGDPK